MRDMNDKPSSHVSSNGTLFKGDRCDFKCGVVVEFPDYAITEKQKLSDVGEFYAWHRGFVWERLNGFAGYDCVELMIGEQQ